MYILYIVHWHDNDHESVLVTRIIGIIMIIMGFFKTVMGTMDFTNFGGVLQSLQPILLYQDYLLVM